jgi:hypothetical protein
VEISRADVVRHFLRREAGRQAYEHRREEILCWCELPDDDLLKRAREFANERSDTNPALLYLVGTPKGDRSDYIERWERQPISFAELYVPAWTDRFNPALKAVRGNLRAFALRFADQFPDDFPAGRPLPTGEDAVIIAIAHSRPALHGSLELVDGAHRVVAMGRAGAGIEKIEAIVGRPK